MSADDGITINRKTLKAYHWQGDGDGNLIAEAETLDELVDKVNKYINDDDFGMYPEYGIRFLN